MNYSEINDVMRNIRQAEEEFNKKIAEILNPIISIGDEMDKQMEHEDEYTKNSKDDNYIRGINDLRAACITFESTSTIAGRRSYSDVKTYFRRYGGVEIGRDSMSYDIIRLCDGLTFIEVVNKLNNSVMNKKDDKYLDNDYIRGINDMRAAIIMFSNISKNNDYFDIRMGFRQYGGVEIGAGACFCDILNICDGMTFIKVVNRF